MNTITLGMRNALRNRTRTSAIVAIVGLSIGMSLVMLISYQAVQQKIEDTKKSIGNTINIRPAGNTGMIGSNSSTLSSDTLAKAEDASHVTKLVSSLSDKLNTEGGSSPMGMGGDSAKTSLKSPVALKKGTNSDGVTTYSGGGLMIAGSLPENFSPPVTIAGSTSPTDGDIIPGGSSLKVTDGKAIDGSKDTNNAMISESMAKKNNLGVGDTFTAYGETLIVGAIFEASTESGDSTVIVSLPAEQRFSKRTDQVSIAVATVDSLDNLATATGSIKSQLGSEADVTSALDQATKALQPLAAVKNVALFSLVGAVVAGAVVILMMMVMVVRERRREIGILKAIGASNVRIIGQFITEALSLTLLGAVMGLVVGIVGGGPVTSSLVDSSIGGSSQMTPGRAPVFNVGDLTDIQAHIGISVLLMGLAGALFIAVLGSSCAGWLIAKVRPAEVMRQE